MIIARQQLLEVYQSALAAVDGESRTYATLMDMKLDGRIAVVAIGKAAASMMRGAVSALGDTVRAGLLITKDGHCGERFKDQPHIQCLTSAHPVPDQRSLVAGQALLSFLDEQSSQCDFVFLISGGASSLVEVLPDTLSLDDLQRVNDWLLGSGWDIAAMNTLRKSLSCIKAGRLAQRLAGRRAHCLMISDVPGNLPHVIGSGLLCAEPDPGLAAVTETLDGPAWLTSLPKAPAAPQRGDSCFDKVAIKLIATVEDAMSAAESAARALGYKVIRHQELLTGDTMTTGQQLARCVREGGPAFHVWGGETTLRLPANPGRGGRNQHLALAAAVELSGCDACYLLAAGTDGSDGPTELAGALVDGQTITRARQAGFDEGQTLDAANSGALLEASGDVIRTGPTGTNVMDLVFGLNVSVV